MLQRFPAPKKRAPDQGSFLWEGKVLVPWISHCSATQPERGRLGDPAPDLNVPLLYSILRRGAGWRLQQAGKG